MQHLRMLPTQMWNKLEIHATPKHEGWLNQAEIEVGMWARECMGKRRFSDVKILSKHTQAWNRDANPQR